MSTTNFYSVAKEKEEKSVGLFGDHVANLENAHKAQ
jgi:hypothetical protein